MPTHFSWQSHEASQSQNSGLKCAILTNRCAEMRHIVSAFGTDTVYLSRRDESRGLAGVRRSSAFVCVMCLSVRTIEPKRTEFALH